MMFWKLLTGLSRATFHLSRSATALGAAIVISVGVYDFLKTRREREARQLPRRLR